MPRSTSMSAFGRRLDFAQFLLDLTGGRRTILVGALAFLYATSAEWVWPLATLYAIGMALIYCIICFILGFVFSI